MPGSAAAGSAESDESGEAMTGLLRNLMFWFSGWWWPERSCYYRDRKKFVLVPPEESLPANESIPNGDVIIAPILTRRTVRSTQPPSKRSLNGGRRK